MDLSPDNIEHIGRGLLWFTGTSVGAHYCFKERGHDPFLLTFLGIVCTLGAIFNIFVIFQALQDIF